jgi:DNA-binding transcriptional regulator YhcF (GntR family)
MTALKENEALRRIVVLIKEWTGATGNEEAFEQIKTKTEIDLFQKSGNWSFGIEYRNSSAAQFVAAAIDKLKKNIEKTDRDVVPVVAVPYMGDAGRRLCAENKVSWMDLSGNADITAPGLKIYIEGKANSFKSAGRPKDIFAPKSSRITRHLLLDSARFITQRELSNETNLDEGLVSRVVREMEKTGLLQREQSAGGVRPKDPNILLDAWHEKYSFSKHKIIKGFVAERTSNLIVQKLAESFTANDVKYALTGLSAAWVRSHFALYRTSTIYLSEEPSETLLKEINFTEGEKGNNTWLVIPNDEGVFDGSSLKAEICCVHPVQIYLDLKGHPERAKEAAQKLREEFLTWKVNAD